MCEATLLAKVDSDCCFRLRLCGPVPGWQAEESLFESISARPGLVAEPGSLEELPSSLRDELVEYKGLDQRRAAARN